MAGYRRLVPLFLLALATPLTGCVGIEGAGVAAAADPPMVATAATSGALKDEADELAIAKQHFRDRGFGLAETHFRRAVERDSSNPEAWLGLAATHDQLGRFDLADREYAQVEKKSGRTLALYNNRGYSYLMRGDYPRARRDFNAARNIAPDNSFVANNLRELDEKSPGGR